MKIGLIDVDSHNWPNLCLMKLSAYHKARGDLVEWWNPGNHYDLVYKSRVFTDTYSLIAKSLKVLDITGFSAFTATNLLLFYYF